jgi:hypothetical protein
MDKKPRNNIQAKPKLSALRGSTQWHAVSISTGRWCCEAARGLIGTRYLSQEAPRLPLRDCSAGGECACTYRHHNDRRGQARRKDEVLGMRRNAPVPIERRATRGRREQD